MTNLSDALRWKYTDPPIDIVAIGEIPPGHCVISGTAIIEWAYPGEPQPDEATLIAEYEAAGGAAISKRQMLSGEIWRQVPTVTLTDTVRDHAAQAKVEQTGLRAEAAELTLALTDDQDLDAFDPDLAAHEIQEKDYARNIATQEARNISIHEQLVASGGEGIYSTSEVSEIRARIKTNEDVSKGIATGVATPDTGSARQDTALDAELTDSAIIKEVMHHWAPNDYFVPYVLLSDIPDGVNPAGVVAMVYDGANTYRGWIGFRELADGRWESKSDEASTYTSIGQTQSSLWRVAVTSGGTQSEYEITRRVHLVPPQISTSKVRWGGRNGTAAIRRRRR